jgi:hypothetical protein
VSSLSLFAFAFFMLVMIGAFAARSAAGFGAVLIAMPMLAFVLPISTAVSVTTALTAYLGTLIRQVPCYGAPQRCRKLIRCDSLLERGGFELRSRRRGRLSFRLGEGLKGVRAALKTLLLATAGPAVRTPPAPAASRQRTEGTGDSAVLCYTVLSGTGVLAWFTTIC